MLRKARIKKNKTIEGTILVMYADEFLSKHNNELLGHLESIANFKQGTTLNFATNIRIGAQENVPVLNAFNIYLQQLSREGVSRIIINNI